MYEDEEERFKKGGNLISERNVELDEDEFEDEEPEMIEISKSINKKASGIDNDKLENVTESYEDFPFGKKIV